MTGFRTGLARLLDPRLVLLTLFAAQATFWVAFMPDLPVIPDAAGRYESSSAMLRFVVLFALLLAGCQLGRLTADAASAASRTSDATGAEPLHRGYQALLAFRPWTHVALVLAVVGEGFYLRNVIADPSIVIRAWLTSGLAAVGESAQSTRIVGLSSLDNLFVIPTALYALLVWHPLATPIVRRFARQVLLLLGVMVLAHGLLASQRIFIVYYATILLGALLLVRARTARIAPAYLVSGLVAAAALLWIGETLRSGQRFALEQRQPLFGAVTQRHVRDVLVTGYFASDFNNALITLDCRPSMQLVATTALRGVLARPYAQDTCPHWESRYGTVNVLALWWFEAGWFAGIIALLLGGTIGALHALALRTDTGLVKLAYLIMYPGLFASMRTNFYGSSMFLLCASFVAITVLFTRPKASAQVLVG